MSEREPGPGSSPEPTPEPTPESGPSARGSAAHADGLERAPRLARQAIAVTLGVYAAYALLGLLPVPDDLRYLALVAAFYFLPGWLLRRDPARAASYQVGPDRVVPAWSWRGAKVAGICALAVFPAFVVLFFVFYARVCAGELDVLAPVLWVEGLTPWAGGLEDYLQRLCRPHEGGMWPGGVRLPADWLAYGGLGTALAVAVEVFAVALPEEVFHRGYLMSALEERWPPRRRIFGVPLGLAAVLASLLFAVGHLVGMAEVARLATFFPALVFSWLWRRAGSLWAPALFHAASNLLMAVLIASTFPP